MNRRAFLTGLLAAPAVVAIGNLMPIRGIIFDPIVRLQSWPFGGQQVGDWWSHTGPLSGTVGVERAIRETCGNCFSEIICDTNGLSSGYRHIASAGYREQAKKPDRPIESEEAFLDGIRQRWDKCGDVWRKRQEKIQEFRELLQPWHEYLLEQNIKHLAEVCQWGG